MEECERPTSKRSHILPHWDTHTHTPHLLTPNHRELLAWPSIPAGWLLEASPQGHTLGEELLSWPVPAQPDREPRCLSLH